MGEGLENPIIRGFLHWKAHKKEQFYILLWKGRLRLPLVPRLCPGPTRLTWHSPPHNTPISHPNWQLILPLTVLPGTQLINLVF